MGWAKRSYDKSNTKSQKSVIPYLWDFKLTCKSILENSGNTNIEGWISKYFLQHSNDEKQIILKSNKSLQIFKNKFF